ncbi:MAG: hypothetical protein ACFFCP_12190 [Promethearchaeota archaeon]
MNKDELIASLESLQNDLDKLRKEIRKITAENIYKSEIKNKAKTISRVWFENVRQALPSFGQSEDAIRKYDEEFKNLTKAALPAGTKTSTYARILDEILDDFEESLLLPAHIFAGEIVDVAHLEKILESIIDEDERRYLEQAIGCARHGFLSGSVVLGWSAAIDRMQKKIEQLGFDQFNAKAQEMKNKDKGRFKRFNKKFTVTSLNELRADVFDTDLLWVLEGLGLIDKAQHDSLDDCYTKRCNAAHPGEAQISRANLASFYSDLKRYIFDNPKFAL